MLTLSDLCDFGYDERQSYYSTLDKQLQHAYSGHTRFLNHAQKVIASNFEILSLADLIDHWKKHEWVEQVYIPCAIIGERNDRIIQCANCSKEILKEIEYDLTHHRIDNRQVAYWLENIAHQMDEEVNWLENLKSRT